jgi:hypothetical protein
MATNLPPLANVEQLSKNVVRVMGGNPSKVCHLPLAALELERFGLLLTDLKA